ncbi:YihY/virulence factor BrkB family protein [Halomonas elongata]|uniref:YihY/virulence factor BrkB family protein n=1 Tax=Halomonas elongata TaxID=2746 RepID=A0A1B8P2B9_HALEL|nr:YihY/virulence factor BrkB family protein [Halomonas elongata]OBX36425.1 ribonuclease BN/unknown domain fusion protein [Halomonas elongata]
MIKQSVMTIWTLVRDFVLFWWTVVRDAVKLWLERNAFSYAGSLAFYTLFSLAPTVIIAVTVIGLVLGEDAAQGQIVAQLEGTMGASAAELVQNAVAQSRIQESGLMPTLLGLGALVVGATTVFGQMQFSLNTLWGVTARPSSNSLWIFIKNRTLSLTVVLSIGFILLVSLALGVMVKAMLKAADGLLPFVGFLTNGAEFLVSLALVSALFATIFKVLPDVVLRWRDVLVGAVVTALLFAVGRTAISVYLAYTATASAYGAAGSVVVVLLWVYYSSLILLFGAAFTKCHLVAKGQEVIPRNSAVLVKRELLDEAREERGKRLKMPSWPGRRRKASEASATDDAQRPAQDEASPESTARNSD